MSAPLQPPSIREMARLALPLGSALAGGALGLGRPLRWARASGVLSPLFPALEADDVALLDLVALGASHPGLTLERVVRELGTVGVAAIVVRGAIGAGARREADRRGLPLFALPEGAEVARVARAINRLVTDREGQEEAQGAALYRRLTGLVAEGGGLEGIVAELARLTGHAVSLLDRVGDPLARAGSAPDGSDELSRVLDLGGVDAARLRLRDHAEALDPFSRIALEQGAAALALELSKREAVEAAREGTHGDFVATVLDSDEARWASRARAADYPFDGAEQWALVAALGPEEEEALRDWFRGAIGRAEAMGWVARGAIHARRGGAGWRATLLLASPTLRAERERALLRAELRAIAPPGLSIAAGAAGGGAEGLRRALAQASDALLLGVRLFGPGRDHEHRELGIYRLLRHLQGSDDLHAFLADTLAPLEHYDEAHGAALVETLRVLLAHGSNLSATAKAMHLHRNSLHYRVERIRAVAGLDPLDPEAAFALRLALLLAPLR